MHRLAAVVLALFALLLIPAQAQELPDVEVLKLGIIHTNDTHGHLLPYRANGEEGLGNAHLITFMAVVIVLGGLRFLLMKTRLGVAIRATAQDREVANLMGMNESRVAMITVGISLTLAAVTGAVIAPLTIVDPFMWMHPLIMMMAVVVLGGLGSIKGSFIAAYILGLAESLVVFLIPMGAFLKGSVALSIMILVLLLRPEGLYGVVFEEER